MSDSSIPVIQEAIDTAFTTFKDLESGKLRTLVNKIDRLSSDELGCKKEHLKYFSHIFTKIIENDDFQFSIFYVKKGFCLPLHDHPNMRGIMKV